MNELRYTNYSGPPPYPIVKTDKVCADPLCQKTIQPGQSYVPTVFGPVHIACGSMRPTCLS